MKKPEVILVTITQTRTVPVLATSSKAAKEYIKNTESEPSANFWSEVKVEIRASKITKLTQITRAVRDGELFVHGAVDEIVQASDEKTGETIVTVTDAWVDLGLAPKKPAKQAKQAKRGRPVGKKKAKKRAAKKA